MLNLPRVGGRAGLPRVAVSFRFSALSVCAGALILTSFANGQTATGSISGLVKDPSGSALSGANATLTNTATNEARSVTTNTVGLYSFLLLPLATYRLEVKQSGFRNFVVDNFTLNLDSRLAATSIFNSDRHRRPLR